MVQKLLAIIFLTLLLVVPWNSAYASTDTAFTTTGLNRVASVVVQFGNSIGFDIFGFITPIFNKERQIAAPDHEPTAVWKEAFTEYFTPQSYKEDGKHVDWIPNQLRYSALYGAILKTDAEHSNHPPHTDCIISTNPEISSPIPFAELDFQKAREADAWLGINPVDPDENGVIDFNLPPKIISGMSSEDCKRMDPGVELTKIENDAKQLSQFGEGAIITQEQAHEIDTVWITIKKLINGVWTEWSELLKEPNPQGVILTIKKHLDYYSLQCHDGGCPESEAGEYSGNAAISGGYAAFTLREEDKKPLEDASLQGYEVTVAGFLPQPLEASYDIRNQSETRQKQAACYMVPDTTGASYGDLQATAAIGGTLEINKECKPILVQCPIDVVLDNNPDIPDTSCTLNAGGYPKDSDLLTEFEQSAFPGGMPTNLTKVLNYVGGLYSVPPSLILATMLEEQSFEHSPVWQWTDETVRSYSDCTRPDPMPNCNDAGFQSGTGAKGPLGLFQTQIDKVDLKSSDPYNNPYWKILDDPAFKDVLANRPEGTFSACNFFDAAIYAAWDIYTSHSHLFVPGVPSSCTLGSETYPISQEINLPASCSDWDAARVGLARFQYGGYAYDPAEQGAFCDGIARVENTFNKY